MTASFEAYRICDSLFNELNVHGVGASTKKMQPLSPSNESTLWSEDVLRTDTQCPRSVELQNTGQKTGKKVVHQYETPECSERCQVALLNKYIAKFPPEAFDDDVFCLQPLTKPTNSLKLWYSRQPLGLNALARIIKMMSKTAGLKSNFTNHSLRAYDATEIFQKGVPKNLMQ